MSDDVEQDTPPLAFVLKMVKELRELTHDYNERREAADDDLPVDEMCDAMEAHLERIETTDGE